MPELENLTYMVQTLVNQRADDRQAEKDFREDIRDAVHEIREEAKLTLHRVNQHELTLSTLAIRLEALQKEHAAEAVRVLKQEERLQAEFVALQTAIRAELQSIDSVLRTMQQHGHRQRGAIDVAKWIINGLWALVCALAGAIGATLWSWIRGQ